jgi:hypothetical protein
MSALPTPPSHAKPADFEVAQEDDAVAARTIGAVMTTAVVVTVLAVAVAGWTLSATRSGLPWHEQASAKAAPRQIAGIHQTPIERDRHGWELRERQRRSLEKYGWIDHDRGIAQIPIDRAIDIVIDDAAKANGRAP